MKRFMLLGFTALLTASCTKTGEVAGIAISDCASKDDSVALSVKTDDGRTVEAGRGKDRQGGRITGGQKVKVKKAGTSKSGTECWEVVEWL